MRKPKDNYFIDLVKEVAKQSTCPRKAVGCLIVDEFNLIIATGYNGVPIMYPHCIDINCGGKNDSNKCKAVHAEQNALLQCSNVYGIDTIYCTHSPCMICAKMIGNTSCSRFVYEVEYKDNYPIEFLKSLGVEMVHLCA